MKLSKKWRFLVDSPFKVSEKCCDVMKKRPLHKYSKQNNRYPFIGTLADESNMRQKEYMKHGCNVYNTKEPFSTPLAFWTNQNILEYIKKNNMKICSVYGNIIEENNILTTSGEKRTGCIFCMFGVQFDESPNRFERLKETHPKLHNYCINKLNLKEVLDFIDIKY